MISFIFIIPKKTTKKATTLASTMHVYGLSIARYYSSSIPPFTWFHRIKMFLPIENIQTFLLRGQFSFRFLIPFDSVFFFFFLFFFYKGIHALMISLTAWARLLFYAVLLTACLYLTSDGNKLNRSLWWLITYIHGGCPNGLSNILDCIIFVFKCRYLILLS